MRAYMINTAGRRHAEIYGDGAFFDLDRQGPQAAMLAGIVPGTECYVASYADKQRTTVAVSKYIFENEAVRSNENPGELCRAFFGRKLVEIRLPKEKATLVPELAPFFNKRGHFLRRSAYFWPAK